MTVDLERRLRLTYTEALRAQHGSARVEIHVGSDVAEELKDFVNTTTAFNSGVMTTWAWGFPITTDADLPPDAIQVHSINTIN